MKKVFVRRVIAALLIFGGVYSSSGIAGEVISFPDRMGGVSHSMDLGRTLDLGRDIAPLNQPYDVNKDQLSKEKLQPLEDLRGYLRGPIERGSYGPSPATK